MRHNHNGTELERILLVCTVAPAVSSSNNGVTIDDDTFKDDNVASHASEILFRWWCRLVARLRGAVADLSTAMAVTLAYIQLCRQARAGDGVAPCLGGALWAAKKATRRNSFAALQQQQLSSKLANRLKKIKRARPRAEKAR